MQNNLILSVSRGFLIILASFSSFVFADTPSDIYAQELSSSIVSEDDLSLIKRKSIFIIKKRVEKMEEKGILVGDFNFSPSVALTEYSDDNIYATNTGLKDDLITVITPTLNVKSNWNEHSFKLDAGLEVTRHADLTTENTNNSWININAKYDLNKKHNLYAGLAYMRDHEDRASPDDEAGYTPTKFDNTSAHFGYAGSNGNNYFKLAYKITNFDFYDVNSLSGTVDNDDRDRNNQAIGIRYLYKYSSSGAVFIKTVLDKRDYEQAADNEGNERTSNGYNYSVGLEIVSVNTVSTLYVGTLNRDYKDFLFEDITESDFGFQHNWKFLPSSNLVVKVSRSIEETTLNSSPGYLMTDGSVHLGYSLTNDKALNVDVMMSTAEYYANTREDDYLDYGVGYSQKILKNLQFTFELQRAERDSNIAGQDYTINQVFLRINAVI